MKESFDTMIPWVFEDEGEYSNDKGDDGGPTRLGITYIDLARHRGISEKAAYKLVRGMDPDECKAIYKRYYWDPLSADLLPPGVDYFLFDSGLLSGDGTAAKWLQRSVGVSADGKVGPVTIAAANNIAPITLIGDLVTRRRNYLKSLKKWALFGNGWTNRVNKSRGRALKLAGLK